MRYEKATEGIRVQVRPHFSLADSDPADGTFVFAYHVSMENEGDTPAKLLFRHWLIHDAVGFAGLFPPFFGQCLFLLLQLVGLVAQIGGLFEVLIGDGVFLRTVHSHSIDP